MKKASAAFLVCFVVASGCSSSKSTSAGDGSRMAGFDPGPAPANGLQVVLPIVHDIEAGKQYEYCTWTDQIVDHDLQVKSVQGLQTKTGHHTSLYYTTTLQPPNTTRLCTDQDMATFRFTVAAGGEGAGESYSLPGDLAVKIPKGAQIVINHHYLNAGADTIADAQSAVNIGFADPNQKILPSGGLAVLVTSMSVPPGCGKSIDVRCKMNHDYPIYYFVPHMHQYGSHMTVEHIPANGQATSLFDLDWDPNYQFHAPTINKDPSAPYMLHAGDEIHINCRWDNPTSGPLTFGMEMCVLYGGTIDSAGLGNQDCDAGQWTTF